METVVINLAGKARSATLNGRPHLVAPLVLIVPGVLNGSRGPLYYPLEEIERTSSLWAHMPIVVYHPLINGQPVSARDPDILSSRGVGVVLRPTTRTGKLAAEGWFDIEATRRIDSRVLTALELGESLELSTGLSVEQEPAPEGAVHNGIDSDGKPFARPYLYTARNYMPDHLAVLPDQVGACSVKDGCGVLVNSPSKLSHSELRDRLSTLVKGKYGPGSVGAAMAGMSSGMDEGMVRCWIVDVFDKFVVYRMMDRLYKLPYTTDLRTGTVELGTEAPVEVVEMTSYRPVSNLEGGMNRDEIINWLTNNCDCWKAPEDREVLNKLTDSKLQALKTVAEKAKQQEAVANAATKGFHHGDVGFRYDTERGAFVSNSVAPSPVAAPATPAVAASASTPASVPAVTSPVPVARPLTAKEWLDAAPAEVQSAVRNAMEVEGREKETVINRLLTNVQGDEAKKAATAFLSNKSLGELRSLLMFAAAPAVPAMPFGLVQPPTVAGPPAYVAAGGGPAPGSVPVGNSDPDDEPLVPITINWAEAVAKRA